MKSIEELINETAPFGRDSYKEAGLFSYIGKGHLGGKALGLLRIRKELTTLAAGLPDRRFELNIPGTVVITTEYFDDFIRDNGLLKYAAEEMPDERISHHFMKAELPARLSGDLRLIAESTTLPLAVRSSSMVEDSLDVPLAGVFETKMIPNNHPDPDERFRKLMEAVKFVYSSTYFNGARTYFRSIGKDIRSEKMAVLIQEVVGRKYYDRFYPDISGVAKSYNFYSSGHAEPEDGVVSLALGLGKTIVEGGMSWNYCPRYPEAPPPYNSVNDLLKQSQTSFWAVNMGKIAAYDPVKETEFLVRGTLKDSEYDNTLSRVASAYNAESDRFEAGTASPGPRLINFAPLLQSRLLPLNDLIVNVLELCESYFQSDVEIEFAVSLGKGKDEPNRFSMLQVRPMQTASVTVDIETDKWGRDTVLTASDKVLGNGENDILMDIVYIKPETFELKRTGMIAEEIKDFNRALVNESTGYLLIGFGRWGSSDPWLGIPVDWGGISGAQVIVESSLSGVFVDMSQGSHFFHNLSNLGIFYFSISAGSSFPVDWDWLSRQKTIRESANVRQVRLQKPLCVRVDGKKMQGVVFK